MTMDPPTPPVGDPAPEAQVPLPPPPPPAAPSQPAWSAPGGAPGGSSLAGFDPKTVNPFDWAILAAGFLAFIFSFFSYYTASVSFAGVHASASENAWHGFFGWFGALVALAAAGVLATALFAPQAKLPMPHRMLTLIGFGVATLCVILAAFITPGVSGAVSGVDFGRGVGFWLSLIVILGGLVASYLRLSGGKLPWQPGGNPFAKQG